MPGKTPARTPRRGDEDKRDDERYPNLAAQRDWDRAQHVKQGLAAGLTKEQARKHADDEVREGED